MMEPELKKTIREIPDFPKPGINFYDVSTLFRDGKAFQATVDQMTAHYRDRVVDAFAGIEARGFMLAGAMSYALGVGSIMIRKPGKLPHDTDRESYTLEYGEATIEIHRDAVQSGQRIVVVDDLLATGGTAAAAERLIGRLGGTVESFAFMVELGFLDGRRNLGSTEVFSLLKYP
jgi:adenine phosphoribosyltransferase